MQAVKKYPTAPPAISVATSVAISVAITVAIAIAIILVLAATVTLLGCSPAETPTRGVELSGRAILAADTFADGPPVGRFLAAEINGRKTPFASVPVQGFSSLVRAGRDNQNGYIGLSDNGFGSQANSGDVPLRWYRLGIDLAAGTVTVRGHVDLNDSLRVLTGADFDPESLVRLDDGTFWIGEEFGPFLLHVDGAGRLLAAPVSVPVPEALRPHARGRDHLRSPDHPELAGLADDAAKLRAANLPRSGGVEGLARNRDGTLLYVAVEKALLDDPERDRRLILAFDTQRGVFTNRHWYYRMDRADLSIASIEAFGADLLLVTERDEEEGHAAEVKRIYRVRLGHLDRPGHPDAADAAGYLRKELVCDLLHIADPRGISSAEPGALGLGDPFSFPFVTPECLLILDARTLLVANDNNYPMSTGRRPPDTPDDSEFIQLSLPTPLQ